MGNMKVLDLYYSLLSYYGRQHWWPAKTEFEVIVGAIFVQQTSWRSVERAISNLEKNGLLDPLSLASASQDDVESLIKNLNFYKQKAKRIIEISKYIVKKYGGRLDKLFSKPLSELRDELLSLEGIGEETADIILLYAANKLSFPVDAYTRRLIKRLGLIEKPDKLRYSDLKNFFEKRLLKDLEVYKEFHALIDVHCKTFCRRKPLCNNCPLKGDCKYYRTQSES